MFPKFVVILSQFLEQLFLNPNAARKGEMNGLSLPRFCLEMDLARIEKKLNIAIILIITFCEMHM